MTRTLLLFAFALAARANPSLDAYLAQVDRLVSAHRAGAGRLAAPAAATSGALLAGGRFFLNGDGSRAWFYEAVGRAGGFMQIDDYFQGNPRAGDVVWFAYSSATYSRAVDLAAQLARKNIVVVAFGPSPEAGPPPFSNWVDSLSPWSADDRYTLLANVFSLWSLEGEVAAATSRQGKSLVFWQSIIAPGGPDRNARYAGHLFHDGFPQMDPVGPGILGAAYLDRIASLVAGLREAELPQIEAAGTLIARRVAAGDRPVLYVISHILPFINLQESSLFRFTEDPASLGPALASSSLLVCFGYSGVDLELWRKVRLAGATAVWITGELPNQADFSGRGDLFINQHWQLGDASIPVPGYDVRILPVSGVAQLLIYELLLRSVDPLASVPRPGHERRRPGHQR